MADKQEDSGSEFEQVAGELDLQIWEEIDEAAVPALSFVGSETSNDALKKR